MEENLMENEMREVPRNFGPLRGANGNARLTGSCGDTVEFWVYVEDGEIFDATATSDGCDHSLMASCTVAAMIVGMPVDIARNISESDILLALDDFPASSRHCVVLSLEAMHKALDDYELKAGQAHQRLVATSQLQSVCKERPDSLRRTLMVMSGKGGVGKSTVAVNLAVSLAREGFQVGLVDVDIHGPSIPTMLNLHDASVRSEDKKLFPLVLGDLCGLKVMSLGFMLQNDDDPVIWRGPLKNSLIDKFINDVQWGNLDYLVVDCPPGTGDEPLSVVQLLKAKAEAVLVTTPQSVSTVDVARSINFCKRMELPIIGIIENMSGFICPHCHQNTDIFRTGGGRILAQRYGIPFLGAIPLDPAFGLSGDIGQPFVDRFASSPISAIYRDIIHIIQKTGGKQS
ncbi:MAG: P-loop NTPase [Sphaerochaetaceae bacterium]